MNGVFSKKGLQQPGSVHNSPVYAEQWPLILLLKTSSQVQKVSITDLHIIWKSLHYVSKTLSFALCFLLIFINRSADTVPFIAFTEAIYPVKRLTLPPECWGGGHVPLNDFSAACILGQGEKDEI